jgi:hypothetical protein
MSSAMARRSPETSGMPKLVVFGRRAAPPPWIVASGKARSRPD